MDVDEPRDSDLDSIMDEDDEQPRQKKRKGKKKARNSTVNLAAMTSEQEALAALESNEVLHLRLRKKYYSEALNFIKTIESSMDSVIQLLGSTNKAEVLESMEFFRVTSEYEFQTSEVVVAFFLRSLCLTIVSAWDQTHASFDMVERQQPNFRGWERAEGCALPFIGVLPQLVL